MIALGKFFFRYRNILGPVVFGFAIVVSRPGYPFGGQALAFAFEIVGVIVVMLGEVLRVVTIGYEYIVRGGRNRQVYADKLVQGGVFAHSRNPLYLGNILIAVGLALVLNASAFYLVAIPSIVLAYRSIVAAEEDYLRAKFGAQYEAYCCNVGRWWPRISGFGHSIAGMRFNWRRVLVKEYSTIFILFAALVCLHVWREYTVVGAAALPSAALALTGVVTWTTLYLTVRALKKNGHLDDRGGQEPT